MIRYALVLLAGGLCVTHGRVVAAGEAQRANVLLIIADDLNCDVGCYGASHMSTPHIDALAEEGLRFDRAYVQYPVCNPSRSSFLSGLRPETTGILDNRRRFREALPDAVTLPEWFRQQGYYTAGLGKVFHRGLSPDDTQADRDDERSFDHVFYGRTTDWGRQGTGRNLTGGQLDWCRWLAAEGDDDDHADGQITTEAIRLLTERRDEPLFLAVGYYRPHDPFESPAEHFTPYPIERMRPPVEPTGYRLPYRHDLGNDFFKSAFDRFGDREKSEFLAAYYAGVSFVDSQVGRLLATLQQTGVRDETVIVFAGDHGYDLGLRNWWNKNTLFESSCRTPLIVNAPGGRRGKATKAIVEFTDLFPTIAELAGLPAPDVELEGESFADVVRGESDEFRDAALTVVSRNGFLGRSVRTQRWRYTEWDKGRRGRELYDHDADPGEWNNLAGESAHYDGIMRSLSDRLREL
ncbi:MAG: sulfatase [Planctomycetota bacterium]